MERMAMAASTSASSAAISALRLRRRRVSERTGSVFSFRMSSDSAAKGGRGLLRGKGEGEG